MLLSSFSTAFSGHRWGEVVVKGNTVQFIYLKIGVKQREGGPQQQQLCNAILTTPDSFFSQRSEHTLIGSPASYRLAWGVKSWCVQSLSWSVAQSRANCSDRMDVASVLWARCEQWSGKTAKAAERRCGRLQRGQKTVRNRSHRNPTANAWNSLKMHPIPMQNWLHCVGVPTTNPILMLLNEDRGDPPCCWISTRLEKTKPASVWCGRKWIIALFCSEFLLTGDLLFSFLWFLEINRRVKKKFS